MDPNSARVVYLEESEQVIGSRLRDRAHHFTNPAFLQSQLYTPEEPRDVSMVDVSMVL